MRYDGEYECILNDNNNMYNTYIIVRLKMMSSIFE